MPVSRAASRSHLPSSPPRSVCVCVLNLPGWQGVKYYSMPTQIGGSKGASAETKVCMYLFRRRLSLFVSSSLLLSSHGRFRCTTPTRQQIDRFLFHQSLCAFFVDCTQLFGTLVLERRDALVRKPPAPATSVIKNRKERSQGDPGRGGDAKSSVRTQQSQSQKTPVQNTAWCRFTCVPSCGD